MIIDLKFFPGIKKVVPDKFSHKRQQGKLRYLEECYDDKNHKHQNSEKSADHFARFGESIENSQSDSDSYRQNEKLENRDG